MILLPKRIAVFFLTFLVLFSGAQNADLTLLKSINGGNNPGLDDAMKYTSLSIYPAMGLTAGGILVAGYVKKDKEMIRNGCKTVATLGFNIIITEAVKYSVQRRRPFEEYPNDIVKRADASGYSFPSGHTSSAFATATALTLSFKKWYVAVPAYLYAGTVAYSRMRLGVHYPTDILGGIVTGTGSALLTWQVDKWIRKKRKKEIVTGQ